MDMQNITKITLAWELHQAGILKQDIAARLEVNRDTIRLWMKGIEEIGLLPFLDQYIHAKKGERKKRQVDPILKRWIWEIRDREKDCCGQKIQYFLGKEHGVSVSVPKIYEILKEKLTIKSKWKKNQRRGPIPTASQPREVVQMDTIDFGGIFAFTAVDIFTREADILLAPELTSIYGHQFLIQSMRRRFNDHVHLVQTDGGPEFKDEFKHHIHEYCDRHRVSRPYKKNEQSYIESFNRSVRKECLGWITYRTDQLGECTTLVEEFLDRYHYHRPHMGIGMKPPLA
jgi:transposase